MSNTEVLMAGFGGQGMLLSGKLLAHAALEQGLQVSWLPSYGPEMRGGTANVTVVISENPVGSPYVVAPRALVVMNQPSLEKFGPRVKPGGLIVVNTSLVSMRVEREDCAVLYLPANDLARQAGTARAANLVMLGAYVGLSQIVDSQTCIRMIEQEFDKKPKLIPTNVAAYQAGHDQGIRAREARS